MLSVLRILNSISLGNLNYKRFSSDYLVRVILTILCSSLKLIYCQEEGTHMIISRMYAVISCYDHS
jgi:hypothetical protein